MFPQRDESWQALCDHAAGPWDLIVVGGGVTGAGILREAAARGHRSLLLEQRDFCWGTSSRSSKLVHGGLRYLAAGNFRLTRHALQERERLLREAPWLVRRLPFCFPLYRGEFPPRLAAGLLFWLYDRLAGIDDHRAMGIAELREWFPGLDADGVSVAYRYTDAVTDDARLVLRILGESLHAGAAARNYSKVTDLLREPGAARPGRVRGVLVRDTVNGETTELEARVVVNATGAWADRLGSPPPQDLRVHPQRGSHLVLDAARFPAPAAIYLRHPDDGRRLFVYPWEGRTIVGTTDLPHGQDLDTVACITAAELHYLLSAARLLFASRPPRAADVISTWSGVRPIIAAGPVGRPSRASREHQVWSEPGLVSCSGGKLTTFHHMAVDVLERAAQDLASSSKSKARRADSGQRIFREDPLGPADLPGLDRAQAERLLGRFGPEARQLVAGAAAEDLQPLGDSGACAAELRWSLRHEAVVHLDDLLLRRSRLGLLTPAGGAAVLDTVRRLCGEAGGWDAERWSFELERYRGIIRDYYSVPR